MRALSVVVGLLVAAPAAARAPRTPKVAGRCEIVFTSTGDTCSSSREQSWTATGARK